MRFASQVFGLVAIVSATLIGGLVHGTLSHRWGTTHTLKAAAKKLQEVPEHFGDWHLESTDTLSDATVNMLSCSQYLLRTYRNKQSQQSVTVVVLLGPSGPISIHTPEVCYSSQDYHQQAPRRPVQVENRDGVDGTFWALEFQSTGVHLANLRVYYAWSSGGRWMAESAPRLRWHSHLYKIQLSAVTQPQLDVEKSDPCREFLEEFVPVLDRYLVRADSG